MKIFDVLENKNNIKRLKVQGVFCYYCEIGKDYSFIKYEIEIELNDKILEFDSFNRYINHFGEIKGCRELVMKKIDKDIRELLNPKDIKIKTSSLNNHATFIEEM